MNNLYLYLLVFFIVIIVLGLLFYIYYLNSTRIKIHEFNPKINRLMTGYSFKFLSSKECKYVIDTAEQNEWTRGRHKYFPTVDQEVKKIPNLKFLITKLETKIYPFITKQYGFNKLKLNDFFVVKYDKTEDGMDELDIHRDTSVINVIITLNHPSEYDGGGTYFPKFNKNIKPNQGEIFVNTGKLKHGGKKITRGTRYILIGFIDCLDDFLNKKYLEHIVYRLKTPDLDVMNNIFHRNLNIYIVNLKERTDRKESISKLIEKCELPHQFKLHINFIEASRGSELNKYKKWITYDKYESLPNNIYKYWQRDIKTAEVGCFTSHHAIIKQINDKKNDENEVNLILEDDANFNEEFFTSLKKIYDELLISDQNWDLCYLGRNKIKQNYESLSENIETAGYSFNTHCYLLSNKGANKIAQLSIKDKIIPYDEFISALSWSHPRKELNKLYFNKNNKLIAYASKHQYSTQKGFGYSDIN